MQGYVSCRCYSNRLAKPHPHSAYLVQPLPGVVQLDAKATEKIREDHEEWLYSACSHDFMQVAWEDLGEPRSQPTLLAALKGAADQVPSLLAISSAEKPPAPWSPEQVTTATEELAWLRRALPPFPVTEVRDADTGELLVETVIEEIYCTTGEGLQLGIAPDGLFAEKRAQRLFTTRKLKQEDLPDGTYRLTPEGGNGIVSSAAFVPYDAENPDRHRATPRTVDHLTVHRGAETLERYLEPLDKLLTAARKAKHSIVWIP